MAEAIVARRVVSLVPSTTESVCMLGAGDALVGCTRYCTEPASDVARAVRVGGTKNPAREAVAALRPDLVLANAEENRLEDIAWFRDRFSVLVQTPRTVVEAAAALRALAERLGVLPSVVPFLLRIEAEVAAAAVDAVDAPPLRVFYAIWRKPWMSIGADTFVHDVLRRVGATNVCATLPGRYPEVTPADVIASSVDVVILPSEPWEFDAAQRTELLTARTFGDARVELCDGRDACWHGVRMADGLGRMRALVGRLRSSR